jgi:hypothetical protein
MKARWRGLRFGPKLGLVAIVMLLSCCGGLTVLGAIAGDPENVANTADDATAADITADATADAPGLGAVGTPGVAAPTSTGTVKPRTAVTKRTVTETASIGYATRRVEDASMAKGSEKVRTRGTKGVRTRTYEVTLTNGKQTGRKLLTSTVTRKPVTRVIAVGTRSAKQCDPNYGDGCVPVASDVDCAGGSGNGPAYVSGVVKVIGDDIYDLDRDNDGYGCD